MGSKHSKSSHHHHESRDNTGYQGRPSSTIRYSGSPQPQPAPGSTTNYSGGNANPPRDVYAPDATTSGTVKRPGYGDEGGQSVGIKRDNPDEYLQILKPKKGPGRMQFNPNIPKTLTPKGYAKLKLMMSVAAKQYETLNRRLKREGKLWEDPTFPANDSSIGIDKLRGQLEWKRPKEINPNAQFFVDGVSRFDIEQGSVGDCWLMAVISSISSYPQLFHNVVPKEQTLQSSDYTGVFRVRFWRFGQWTEVLIDDRLPVRRGTNQLVFMHSAEDNEFWSPLMEKAYAKLNGTYENLSGGTQSEAMEDLTGGVCETIELAKGKRPDDLLEQMQVYEKRCCLMGCSVDSTIIEARLDNGLIAGHAYSVTGVRSVTYRGQKQFLVRCRNPWGGNYEWKGAWSDRAPEWRDVDSQDKQSLNVEFRDDGEFWMSYEDFVTCFSRLEVCHLGLESLEHDQDFRGKRRLDESIFSGQWQKNVSAGGCINNRTSYATNPQFRFTIADPDPEDNDHKTTVIIGLMQKDVRRKVGANFNTIGFMLYKVTPDVKTLMSRAKLLTTQAFGKSAFANSREVTNHFRLPIGDYVIIPSTFEPGVEASFIVRVVSQVAMEDLELDDDNTTVDLPEDVLEGIKMENEILMEDEQMEEKFKAVCNKRKMSINSLQLMELLNGSTLQDIKGFTGFNKEMARSMVASVDHNLTGGVELAEFMDLWQRAKAWKVIFIKHDEDETGSFHSPEFREAINTCGYKVSNKLFDCLVHRYEDPSTDKISFEDFMVCCTRLKNVFDTASAQPKAFETAPTFNMEDYLRMSVYT